MTNDAVDNEDRFSPENVRFLQFPTARRGGLDPDAVGAFLGSLSEYLVDKAKREVGLRVIAERLAGENETIQREVESLRGELGGLRSLMDEAGPGQPKANEQAGQILASARHNADQMLAQAQEQAQQIIADARNRARGIYAQARQNSEQQIVQLGSIDGELNMAATLTERSAQLREAGRRIADAQRHLLSEAKSVMEAAQLVLDEQDGVDSPTDFT